MSRLAPPEPVSHPNEEWVEEYAAWYRSYYYGPDYDLDPPGKETEDANE